MKVLPNEPVPQVINIDEFSSTLREILFRDN